ncbi:hypothetical protein B0J11DRAFT_573252 [Dendryphion nanum]|uniref:C2H2-type domain-containing protein n=1 Tax=Dendryphion nanum TaxID=256645 RepID=A0A9P9D268_9PLEO|nr:hypothetical protein B0J11DRAFT_573252 [Dendryphion nanum]
MSAGADTGKRSLSNLGNCWSDANSGNKFAQTAKPELPQATTAPIPPPMLRMKKPHVCGTCSRPFARLEHLKRHERTHTKEKPFECPRCRRCFARGDLLQRHQQKLHQHGAISSALPNGRRGRMSSLRPNARERTRKNTEAGSIYGATDGGAATVKPRANTISHIDTSSRNGLPALHKTLSARGGEDNSGHSHQPSLSSLNGLSTFDHRAMPTFVRDHRQHYGPQGLGNCLELGLGGEMRTSLSRSPFTNPIFVLTSVEEVNPSWGAGLEDYTAFGGTNEAHNYGSSPLAAIAANQSGSRLPTSAAMWHNPLNAHFNDTFSLNPYGLDSTYATKIYPHNSFSTLTPNNFATTFFLASATMRLLFAVPVVQHASSRCLHENMKHPV